MTRQSQHNGFLPYTARWLAQERVRLKAGTNTACSQDKSTGEAYWSRQGNFLLGGSNKLPRSKELSAHLGFPRTQDALVEA